MFQRELAFQSKSVGMLLRQAKDEEAEEAQVQTRLARQHDPAVQLSCHLGDAVCTGAQAAQLNRTPQQLTSHTLLRLQRQYGNRFVQRVVNHDRRDAAETGVAPAVEQTIHRARGGGQALDSAVRTQMEPAFRTDFSRVRIHTGSQADTLNRALHARAFTTGQDIFFKQGEYNPGSSTGRELLAHELTHVVQQQGGQVQTKLTLGQPGDKYEQEADSVARAIMQREQRTAPPASDQKRVSRQTEEEKDQVQGKADFSLQRQAEADEEEAHTKLDSSMIERQANESEEEQGAVQSKLVDNAILRQPEEEDQSAQTMPDLGRLLRQSDEEESLQTNVEQRAVQRQDDEEQTEGATMQSKTAGGFVQRQTEEKKQEEPIQRLASDRQLQAQAAQASNHSALAAFPIQRQAEAAKPAVREQPATTESAAPKQNLSLFERGAVWLFEKALGAAGIDQKQIMGLVNRAGSAFMQIIQHPGRFLSTIIKALGQGFAQFKDNIGKHLLSGLMEWLFGAVAKAGIQLPKDFSLQSIFVLVLQILEITAEQIKLRLAKVIGEKNVRRLEKAWAIIATFMREGIGGLWHMLKEYLGNLKEMVLAEVKNWLIVEIVKAAVLKVVTMFNPVTGLIAIVKTIYNVIKFLVERARQIAALFQAIAGSVVELALGNFKAAADKIELALARLIPIVIGFLASLLNISGIGEKVKTIIKKIQAPVEKAIDKVIDKVVQVVKKLLGRGGAARAGSTHEKLDRAMAATRSSVAKFAGRRVGVLVLKPILAAIRLRYGLKSLDAIKESGKWTIHGTINPTAKFATDINAEGSEDENLTEQELMDMLLGTSVRIKEGEPHTSPITKLSESSASYTLKVLGHIIQVAPNSEEERNKAMDFLIQKAQIAITGSDSHIIYKALQQAGGRIKRLYKSDKSIVNIHHEQEVSEYPESSPETRQERTRIPEPVEKQMQRSIQQIQKKYSAMKGKTKNEKRDLASRDIAELRELVRQSLLDWNSSRKRDEKGRRTRETEPTTEPIKPLEEIDLIALPVKTHIEVHRQRKKK